MVTYGPTRQPLVDLCAIPAEKAGSARTHPVDFSGK
jgi:hypothetical protein